MLLYNSRELSIIDNHIKKYIKIKKNIKNLINKKNILFYLNLIQIIKNKVQNDKIIKKNIDMANKFIPQMLKYNDLIFLKGNINGFNINIMVDTGCSSCIILNSIVKKCNISNLIDKSSLLLAQGIHDIKLTLGTIWFLEINLDVEKNNELSIPISVEVIDDFDIQNYNLIDNFDLILGISFLKYYKINIDFLSNYLLFNKKTKIKFY